MDTPSVLQKLSYLGGKRAPNDHHPWIAEFINLSDGRRQHLLLSIPNSLIMAMFALLAVIFGDNR